VRKPPPPRVAVAMVLHPGLAWISAFAMGCAVPDQPLVLALLSIFSVLNALLGFGAWFAFAGYLVEFSKLIVWAYAEDGGSVRLVDDHDEVPSDRRDEARRLTLLAPP
jgi:hypothetical protein